MEGPIDIRRAVRQLSGGDAVVGDTPGSATPRVSLGIGIYLELVLIVVLELYELSGCGMEQIQAMEEIQKSDEQMEEKRGET